MRADARSLAVRPQLGTHLRAKNKREEMTGALRKMRSAGTEESKTKKAAKAKK